MSLKFLINNVTLPAGLVWAGTQIDTAADAARFAKLLAAGGVFYDSGIAAIASAALKAGKVRKRGGDPSEAESIMEAASATVQSGADVRHDVFRLPQATGTDLSTTTAKAASQGKAPSAHLTCPRNVQLLTGSWASTVAVRVTLTGTDLHNQPATDVLTIGTGGTTVQGAVAWLDAPTITSWDTPAGWSAGTFKMQTGTKLGLLSPPGSSPTVVKEVGYVDAAAPPVPVNVAVGTVDAANSTYVPGSALDGATDVEVWYV